MWNETETAWRASPFGSISIFDQVMGIIGEAQEDVRSGADAKIWVELAVAIDALLRAEDVTSLEADWPLIDADVSVAVDVRKMLVRRRRWALDYDRLMGAFRRLLISGYRQFVEALPEACFDQEQTPDYAAFTVPIVSLLDNPAEVIEQLLLSVYDDDVFRYDIFNRLRERFATNLVIASGFPPETNPRDVQAKLVMPTRHKSANPAELVDLYLSGTPFEDVFNLPVPFDLPEHIRFEHCHVVGGTGHGKTQLLQRMIHTDLVAAAEDGRSIVVIDSQGDLIQKLARLDLFSPLHANSLADRLIVIDPADVEFPPALNLFDMHTGRLGEYRPVDRERALNGVIELYETFFGALLGAELTQKQGVIFRYLARLMLAIPDATIHTLMQIMEDGQSFRSHMNALDGAARHFFATEFFHPSFAATKKQILKRLWGVLATPAFERMFAQRENKLDLFQAMNDGKIILISTAKDLLKTEGSQLFGRFFISMLAQAALERSVIPERLRTPTFVYVDEAQEYFDDTIETILSQARKYKVAITAAHQTMDQLSPRLRAAFLSNTSFKCAGGVSNKDARLLASELHTSPEFIESMRRRRDHTEFAAWVKHRTPEALRLSVPLGFLERQPTLPDDLYDCLIDQNRERYAGTLEDVLAWPEPTRAEPRAAPERQPPAETMAPSEPTSSPIIEPEIVPRPARQPIDERDLGKGGPKHRYLQSMVKELAEQQGFKATIEAPLQGGGQVDVLLTQGDIRVAVEISVTTAAEHERENVRKCLDAGYERVALILTKSRSSQARYRETVLERLSAEEISRVSFLTPEEVPDFIASLAPPPAPTESVVRGYRVKVSHAAVSPEDAQARRDQLAKLMARTLRDKDE